MLWQPAADGRAAEARSSTRARRAIRGGSCNAAGLLALCWGAAQDRGVQSLACKERVADPSEQGWSLLYKS